MLGQLCRTQQARQWLRKETQGQFLAWQDILNPVQQQSLPRVTEFPNSTQAFHFLLFTISRQAIIIPNPTVARYIESCQTTKSASSLNPPLKLGNWTTHPTTPPPQQPSFRSQAPPSD